MMTFQVTEVDEEENEGSDSPLVMNVIFKWREEIHQLHIFHGIFHE